jgi:asparagine synthase (glutamine-hydrolysing)
MCSISGFVNICVKSDDFTKITSHRGPDDNGIYRHANLVMGHSRLSIQDLSSNGHQPFISKDGRFILVFNGEIYNHWAIREELIKLKYQFFSQSDTETLLNGIRHWGKNILNKLNGIFSFVVFDKEKNEIFMARDQFGVKPFYYYHDGNSFAFASELKAFWQLGAIDKRVDNSNFANYIHFLWGPGENIPFQKIKKLLPGHFIRFNLASVEVKPEKYYEIPFKGKYTNDPEEKLINKLDDHLQAAVKSQMLSDVEVGFFLSGGLDSSLLVAIAKKLYPGKRLQTFTIRTDIKKGNDGFADDLEYARQVSQYLDVDLEIVDAKVDILQDFDKMIWHLEEPQADPAPLNVLNICERARQMGFKVLIGGTAGDDLFSGYRRHQALNFDKYVDKIPLFLRRLLKHLINVIPNINANVRRIKKVSRDIDKAKVDRLVGLYSWLPFDLLTDLFTDKIKEQIKINNPGNYLKSLQANIPDEKNWLNRMLYWEMRSFLVDHNLNYTDKMSMAVGVEVRVPYLDKDLVEFSTTIPPHFKMKGNETKYILKKVAERYLPMDVIYRPKTGFGAPVREWIKNDLDEMIHDRLSPEKIKAAGIFNEKAVWKMITDNKKGKIDAAYTIFSLLAIDSWMHQFVNNSRRTHLD